MKQWLILVVLFFSACGGGSNSRPVPYQTPVPVPSSSTVSTPTPYPTPSIDLTPYLHQQGGRVMTVSETQGDLGAAINSINESLGSEPGKIIVQGGGSIKTPVLVTHDLEFQGEYRCDTETVWQGCILLGDNVTVTGGTIYGPTFTSVGHPSITVFQNSAGVHGTNRGITIRNVRIVDRQSLSDGGVRQTISLGNTVNFAVIGNRIENSAGIGIQAGGTSQEGHHAENGVITGNTIIGSAGAHIAIVNGKDIYVWNNTVLKPGRVGGPGGVSCVDIETNSTDDWAENIWIFNNLCDYREAAFNSVGSAIMAQQRGVGHANGLRIINNTILANSPLGGLTSGIFFTGEFPGGIVASNRIERAGQPCIQLYGARGTTFENNILTNCGGGGLPAVLFQGGGGNTWSRNPILYNEAIGGSVSGEIWAVDSQGNKFDVPVSVRN